MTLEVDLYRARIRFVKLFADPRVFDTPPTFARDYLQSRGLSPEKAEKIYETTEEVSPVDDTGRPSIAAGTGKFHYEGKTLRSEYMQGANIEIEYSDFGSGLRPEDHRKSWVIGKWDDMSFEVKQWNHQHADTGIADIAELYKILRERAQPTTMATVELPMKTNGIMDATVKYLGDQIRRLATSEGRSVEVYAARQLRGQERKALETRLGRDATGSTVYIILTSDSPKQ